VFINYFNDFCIYDLLFIGQVQAKVAHQSASESGAPDDKI
jgi:hypothetical protein